MFVGNGNYLTCSLICSQVKLLLQGHPFLIDLHVLSIEGLVYGTRDIVASIAGYGSERLCQIADGIRVGGQENTT